LCVSGCLFGLDARFENTKTDTVGSNQAGPAIVVGSNNSLSAGLGCAGPFGTAQASKMLR